MTQPTWKKVSDGLPDSDLTVLIAFGVRECFEHSQDCNNDNCALAGGPEDCDGIVVKDDPDEPIWIGSHDGEHWISIEGLPFHHPVTHWMDLPEPPKEGELTA